MQVENMKSMKGKFSENKYKFGDDGGDGGPR
jgi:hypothetical protein